MIKKFSPTVLFAAAALCANSLAHASEMYSVRVDASYYPTRTGEHGNQNSIVLWDGGVDTAIVDIRPERFDSLTPQLRAASFHSDLQASTSMHLEGEARASVTWKDFFTNPSRNSQSYSMHINLKHMALTLPPLHYDGSDFLASFAVDVIFRDFNIWHSSQTLEEFRDLNGHTSFEYHKEGIDLGNMVNEAGASDYRGFNRLDDYFTNIKLGSLLGTSQLNGPGIDGAQVTYRLSTYTKWLSPHGCIETECGQFLRANIADPFGVAGSSERVVTGADVPEPDNWALMFIGLVTLGFVAKRRQSGSGC